MMNSNLKIVAFLMAFFCSLLVAEEPPKKEDSKELPKKEAPTKEDPKKVPPKVEPKKEPPKVEKIQIPPLAPLDQKRETEELKNRLQNFRDYLKNRILFLIQNLEKFKRFDQDIRRASPFISGEFLRGNATNPSADQLSSARKFWVLSPKIPSFVEKILSLAEVRTSVEELMESVGRGLLDPANYGLPFSPFYHQSLREIRDGFEELESSSPPDLVGAIFKTFRLSLEQEQAKLEEWEKNILEQQQKVFQQAQLKDEKLFEEYAKKFPGRKELPLIDLTVSSPERICQDTAGRLYFWNDKEGWAETGTVTLLAQTWRVLKVSGNLPPKGFSRKFCESTFPKVENTLPKKAKIFSLLVPLFPVNYPITRLILGEVKPGLALLLDDWKKKGFGQNTELLIGKAVIEEDFISRLEEIQDLYNKHNTLSIQLQIPPGTKKDSLVIKLGEKTLDLNSPVAVVPTTTEELILKGSWNKKPLWEQVVTIKKKVVKVAYPVRLQIMAGKTSLLAKTDWKALDQKLKTKGKKPTPEDSEVLSGANQALIVRLPDGKEEPVPFPETQLPPYRFLYGSEILVPITLEGSLKEEVKKNFLAFDREYGSYSQLYKTPFSMVKKAIGYKTPFEEVKSKYNNYWEALAQKNRDEAISLYEEISGDKNANEIVDQWIRYSNLIEKYKFQSQQEEQDPFNPLYNSSDASYLTVENIPTDGKLSKAGQLSKYDGTPTKEQLAVMEEISGSLKGLSEGEKYVETLLQGQKDNNQNQIKELKEFLKRDLGPQSNGGNLVNVWVNKRVITLTIENTGNQESIIDLKINGQFILIDPKKQTKTEKMVLKNPPLKLVIPLQIGYNTLEILAHNTGSDGFNSGTLTISSCTRGKEEQKFYLSELEVATLTIYFPPPDLNLK